MPQMIPLWDMFNKDPFHPLHRNQVHHQMMLPRSKANFPVKNVIVDLIYLFLWQCSGLIYCPIKQTPAELLSGRKTTISSKHKQST